MLRSARTARRRVLIGGFGSAWATRRLVTMRRWRVCLKTRVLSPFKRSDIEWMQCRSVTAFLRRAALFQLAFVQTLRHVGKKRCFHTKSTYVFDTSTGHFDFWSPTASRASKCIRSGKGAYSLLSRRARHLFHSTVSPLVGDGPRR